MVRTSQEIVEAVKLLQQRDPDCRLFGASGHRYELYGVTNAEIEELETGIGMAVPLELRRHWLEVGWGAGPFYGLFSPDEVLTRLIEAQDWSESCDLPRISPARPFPVSQDELSRYFENPEEERFIFENDPDGIVDLCEEGCGCVSVLVMEGELIGTMWSHDGDRYCPQWYPLAGEGKEVRRGPIPYLVTFAQWYDLWLDNCLAALSE